MMYKPSGQRISSSTAAAARSPTGFRGGGDVLTLYVRDEFLEKPRRYTISYLRLPGGSISCMRTPTCSCSKKGGLLVHPDAGEYGDTPIRRVQRYLYEKGPNRNGAGVRSGAGQPHRPKPSGIVIAAKKRGGPADPQRQAAEPEIHKHYLRIVHGLPEPREATLEGYLEKNEEQNRVYILKKAKTGARTIATHYRVLEERDGLSLLEVELLTGRTPSDPRPPGLHRASPCWETANMVPTL